MADLYCYTESGGVVEGPKILPKSWRNISGFRNSSLESLIALGWLPYSDTKPIFNADLEYLTSEKVVSATAVTETYTVNDYTAEQMVIRIADAKVERKEVIKSGAQTSIYSYYPIWKQANSAHGMYSEEITTAITTLVTNHMTESNSCEDAVDVCETLEAIRNVIPVWPEV